ncbi:sugar ABC transporter substrate-binding protein [Arthrobacter sp. CG_A4]|uniref:sugar ABC transporter substrate-binding protein n=1 Tax=Arthrobacter sp. CG_A4 TaxID=3071706 RepID=UPI002E095790|nr:arabinogalactan oligomer/maltooligosaccharide transport system substrate-binding protein [Arthrobacter sp. CG_A4]
MRTSLVKSSARRARASLTTAAAVSLMLLASGCSGGGAPSGSAAATPSESPTAAAAPSASDPAPVRGDADLVIWANGAVVQALTPIADKFGKDNGITVAVQAVATELQTNFVTANASGNGPDVVIGAHDWIGNMVQNGSIDPVQITAEQKKAFLPVATDAVTYNGQTYGMPASVESLVLIRNKALAPVEPKSFEELIAAGQAAVESGKAERALNLQVGPKDAYFMQPIFSSAGGYLFGKKADGSFDPSDLGVGKEGSLAAAKKIGELGEKGSKVLSTSVSADNSSALFNQGKTAFMINGPWALGDIKKAGIDYALSPIPGFAGMKSAQPFTGVQAFYVASKGKNKSFAETFVQTVASQQETQRALYEADHIPPAIAALIDEVAKADPDTKVAAEAAAAGIPMPSLPQMAAVWAPLGQAETAIVGGADPAETMTQAGNTIAGALK